LDGRVHPLVSAEALVAAPAATSAAPERGDGSSWGSLQESSMMVGIAACLSRWVMITSGKRQGTISKLGIEQVANIRENV
jgi:hypothetical protein